MSKEVWWAPNATTLGYATKRVVPGSVVMYTYNDDGSAPWELGRVLGEVLVDGCGELYDSTTLLVLEADRRMHHCYERHIPLKWIKEAYDPTKEHAKFAAWFLSPDFLKPAKGKVWTPIRAIKLSQMGTLTDRYLERAVKVDLSIKVENYADVVASFRPEAAKPKEEDTDA